jgi:hypothetical protein
MKKQTKSERKGIGSNEGRMSERKEQRKLRRKAGKSIERNEE